MCVQCDVKVVHGMYLKIVVIVKCFVASVMLSLLINVLFIHSYCKARILIFVNTLYKSPLLLLLL